MKKITFVLIIIFSILCNACKKEDLTTIDITQFSWRISSITVDKNKYKTPKEDYHGNSISNQDSTYLLIFQDGYVFKLDLGLNFGTGKFNIPTLGLFTVESFGTTYICCDSKFDEYIVQNIKSIQSYQVLNDILILKGDDFEIELEKE